MSESKKTIVDFGKNLGMDREVAHILPLSLASEVSEHMPWFSAHSEYDEGYNAGIAAAAAALGLMADAYTKCPGGREAIQTIALDSAARAILTLMRPEGPVASCPATK